MRPPYITHRAHAPVDDQCAFFSGDDNRRAAFFSRRLPCMHRTLCSMKVTDVRSYVGVCQWIDRLAAHVASFSHVPRACRVV